MNRPTTNRRIAVRRLPASPLLKAGSSSQRQLVMNTESYVLPWRNANEITVFEAGDPHENPWVLGHAKIENIEVTQYDPSWDSLFHSLKSSLDIALAKKALSIEHVGSTAVPGLPAKPVIATVATLG